MPPFCEKHEIALVRRDRLWNCPLCLLEMQPLDEKALLLAENSRLREATSQCAQVIREFVKHSDITGDPVGGCSRCLELFERLIKSGETLEALISTCGNECATKLFQRWLTTGKLTQ